MPATLDPVTSGLLGQHAWNVLVYGIAAMVLARYNWRNGTASVIANITLISAADIGFIVFVLGPGHISLADGIHGPILWILGAGFSLLGLRQRQAS